MAEYSDGDLYNILEDMLHGTKKFLCQVFKRRWTEETETDWDKLDQWDILPILRKPIFANANCIESIARYSKKLEDCELRTLFSAILSFCQVEKYYKENDAVTTIKLLRESLLPKYCGKISSHDYGIVADKICSSLKCLGIKEKEIDNLVSQVKRGRPTNICKEEKNDSELRKELLLRCLKTEVHNRKVDAPGEDLFQKGIGILLNKKKGENKKWGQAANLFRQAAIKNHVDATAFLALCYHYDDWGVKKDLDESKKLIEKAAGMDPKSPGTFTLYKCNAGVAGAQASLGTMYFNGQIKMDSEKTSVCPQEAGLGETMDAGGDTDQNSKQAAVWFEKAMENGDKLAAHELALMYSKGLGIDMNDSLAKMCFKESIKLGYASHFQHLSDYYFQVLETEKATYIRKIGMARQPEFFSPEKKKKFDQIFTVISKIRKRYERQVKHFELDYGVDVKGLTFLQRLYVSLEYTNLRGDHFDEILVENIFLIHTYHCLGTARFIEDDPMFKIYPYQQLFQLVEEKQELTESEKLQVLEWVYHLFKRGLRFIPMRQLTDKGIGKILRSLREDEKYQEQGEQDEKLGVCCAAFNLFSHCDENDSIKMLMEGTKRYPHNCIYRTLLCLYYGQKEKWKSGLGSAQEGLKWVPNNVELMYLEAVFFSFLTADTEFDECVKKYENCLRNILEADPIFPDTCYSLSALHLQKLENETKPNVPFSQLDTKLIVSNYYRGLQAKNSQLPCFLPYRTSSLEVKVGLTVVLCERYEESGERLLEKIRKFEDEGPVLERKVYLRSPTRKGLIKLHRQNIKDKKEDNMADSEERLDKNAKTKDSPKLLQTLTNGVSSLKWIALLEMDPKTEHIFKDRLLELTILVEPDFNPGFLASVGEDKDGDVVRVHVYNYQGEENIAEKFSVGSRIAVMNPYLSLTKWDLHSCIRIDDLSCVIYQRRVRNMCGFCGHEDSTHHCSKCQRIYCSKECEELDVERHGHNLVCS